VRGDDDDVLAAASRFWWIYTVLCFSDLDRAFAFIFLHECAPPKRIVRFKIKSNDANG
jgi:hypothetical protein